MVGVNNDPNHNDDEMSMMSCSVMRPPSRDNSGSAWLSRGTIWQASFDEVWDKEDDFENGGNDDFTRVSI
jgi:hypothetical protein